jgi:hypothetical protein
MRKERPQSRSVRRTAAMAKKTASSFNHRPAFVIAPASADLEIAWREALSAFQDDFQRRGVIQAAIVIEDRRFQRACAR